MVGGADALHAPCRAMTRRAIFPGRLLPYLLVAPQLAIVLVFFYWPAVQAVVQSTLRQDPFGLRTTFVWFDNFRRILTDPFYLGSLRTTFLFSTAVVLVAMSAGLLLAVTAGKHIRGASLYKTLRVWPYAVAPAVAAALWLFIFPPTIGLLGRALVRGGIRWDYTLNGLHAMLLVIIASAWKQVSYNFLFFLAGLRSVILLLVVITLTAIQFKYIQRRVYY